MPHPARRGENDVAASLTGGGPSQVGLSGAMRARDVSRPDEDNDATAERLVQVSRRPPRRRPAPSDPRPRDSDSTVHDVGGTSPVRS